jgi:hypothetical protein
MVVNHAFRSGNDCEIHIPDGITPGYEDLLVLWEHYPPSEEDLQEWRTEVYPRLVIPAGEALLRKTRGPGRFVEVRPGVWAWMEAGSRN